MLAVRRNPIVIGGVAVLVVALVAGLLVWRLVLSPPAQVAERYPEPRFPSYLKAPTSVDDVMPFARAAVRQTGGRTPLGLVKPGQVPLLVVPMQADPILIEATRRAYQERGVEPRIIWSHEFKGIALEEEKALARVDRWWTQEQGYMEMHPWLTGRWPNPEEPIAWLKQQRPDLYDAVFPQMQRPDVRPKNLDAEVIRYLDEHPEIDAVFIGAGGRGNRREALKHHGDKLYGNFTYYDRWTAMNLGPQFPGDLWRLAEEKTIEPLGAVDRVRVFDPQGTNFEFDVTEKEADIWSKGAYQQGHLFMIPSQASGKYPYSIIEYPRRDLSEYLPYILSRATGVFAGTTNHAGYHPRVEVRTENGYIKEVKGGGLYGELWRTFLQYPGINEVHYPVRGERPGYWYLIEAGTGTNPKEIGGAHASERNVGGVVHWGFGLSYEPDEEPEFARTYNLPNDHWWHIHNVLLTYRARIRGTEQWVTIIDRGRLTALNSPEARALASRYGDADDVLKQEWVRHLPGINAPGSYQEYSADPWRFERQIDEEIEKGTYRYFSK